MIGGGMMNGLGGFGVLGWIGWILNLVITLGIIVGAILLVVWLTRRLVTGSGGSTYPKPQNQPASPREILQIRYARGEITREQFQQMLDDLS